MSVDGKGTSSGSDFGFKDDEDFGDFSTHPSQIQDHIQDPDLNVASNVNPLVTQEHHHEDHVAHGDAGEPLPVVGDDLSHSSLADPTVIVEVQQQPPSDAHNVDVAKVVDEGQTVVVGASETQQDEFGDFSESGFASNASEVIAQPQQDLPPHEQQQQEEFVPAPLTDHFPPGFLLLLLLFNGNSTLIFLI